MLGPLKAPLLTSLVAELDEVPDVRDAISKMLRAVKRSGIAGGPHTGRNPKEIAEWVEQGATFMAVTTDSSLLYEISAATVVETRDLLGDRLL